MRVRQISKDIPLLLASGSPRRRDILSGLGIPIKVRAPNVDEEVKEDDPQVFLGRVVEDKLRAATEMSEASETCACVLVADTIVVVDGAILGKPEDEPDAFRLLSALAGRTHIVFTRYAIACDSTRLARTVESRVTIRSVSDAMLRRYAATGEGMDKAGAYAVQGIGTFLVRSIDGSYSNVVGLPACEVIEDLSRLSLLADFPGPPEALP